MIIVVWQQNFPSYDHDERGFDTANPVMIIGVW